MPPRAPPRSRGHDCRLTRCPAARAHSLLVASRPQAPAGLSRKMGACRRKALTLLSSVFAVCGLGLLGIAVSTDHWLYLEEGVVLPQNQSTETKMSLHSGLWRVCFLAGKGAQGLGQPCPQRGAAAISHPLGKRRPCWKEAGHCGRCS